MKPISTLLTVILIIVTSVTSAQSFVKINKTVDNFVSNSNTENAIYPYNTPCSQKQNEMIFQNAAVIGGTREMNFNGSAATCSDNKSTIENGSLHIMLNDAGNQWLTTNLMYDANQTQSLTLNTQALQLDLLSQNTKQAAFSLDFYDINSDNDIYVSILLYSDEDAYSVLPVKLSGKNLNTTLFFSVDSLRKHGAATYPVNLNKVGAIRLMIRTKGNTQLKVKNFTLSTLQKKEYITTTLQSTQYLNEVALNWKNQLNENSITNQMVEASADGTNFVTIKSDASTSFTYTDKLQAYSYYRIKIVDLYGRVTYSNIVKTTKMVLNADIKVFPTVVTSSTNVLIDSKEETTYNLQLINTNGQIFLTKILQVSKGINTFTVPIQSATSSTLWISIKNTKNNIVNTFKIVKQ